MALRALVSVARPPACFALAATVAWAGVSYAAPSPKPKPVTAAHARTGPVVVVRAEATAGMRQTVHAYAAPAEAKFVADFPTHLGVRILGGIPKGKRRVKFECVNPGCHLFAPDQPEGGDRKSPSDYSIEVKDGKASLHVSIEADEPGGTYVVYAEPVAKRGERSVRSAAFTLTSR